MSGRMSGRGEADSRWWRTNYAGRPVTLAGGPALVVGAVAATAPAATGPRLPLLIGAVGAVGLYDDLYGTTHARGLRGHLTQLAHGRVTTGIVKLAAISGLAVGLAPQPGPLRRRMTDGLLIAVLANLVNLLDLRPGRAVKGAVLVVAPLAVAGGPTGPAAAGVLAAAAASGLPDLLEHSMLGDCGANALGAAVGWLWAARPGRVAPILVLVAASTLTLASERRSFSAAIDAQPVLRRLDRLGRRG